MIEKKIFLKTLDDVKTFVAIATTKNYDIELLSDKCVVNAKSVMGVLSLDLTSCVTMIANVENDSKFLMEIEPFSAAIVSIK